MWFLTEIPRKNFRFCDIELLIAERLGIKVVAIISVRWKCCIFKGGSDSLLVKGNFFAVYNRGEANLNHFWLVKAFAKTTFLIPNWFS